MRCSGSVRASECMYLSIACNQTGVGHFVKMLLAVLLLASPEILLRGFESRSWLISVFCLLLK